MTFSIRTLKSCIRGSLVGCTSVGLALLTGAAVNEAGAQDRINAVTESAAEIQQTESYGQPYERSPQGYDVYQGDDYYEQDYERSDRGAAYQDRPLDEQRYDRPVDGQRESRQQRDQQAAQRRDGAPAGLGVVLRETGDQGVQVTDVHRGSPAEEAGLEAGDRIVAVDGRNVRSVRELQSLVMRHDPGEQVEVVVIRNGRERTLNAQLDSRSEALNRQRRQQTQFQRDPRMRRPSPQARWQGDTWAQDRQVRARLASVERRLQQLLREVRTLQNAVEVQGNNAPPAPRQAQRGRAIQPGQQQDGQQQGQRSDDFYEDDYYEEGQDDQRPRSYDF